MRYESNNYSSGLFLLTLLIAKESETQETDSTQSTPFNETTPSYATLQTTTYDQLQRPRALRGAAAVAMFNSMEQEALEAQDPSSRFNYIAGITKMAEFEEKRR